MVLFNQLFTVQYLLWSYQRNYKKEFDSGGDTCIQHNERTTYSEAIELSLRLDGTYNVCDW